MQVISGVMGKEKVHYQAPPARAGAPSVLFIAVPSGFTNGFEKKYGINFVNNKIVNN
jgi:hypothetical protein